MTSTRDDFGGESFDRQEALRAMLFKTMGIDGVYARTAVYEQVVGALDAFVDTFREGGTEILRFPPVMSRRDLERHGYLKSFPNLIACACSLHGTEAEIRESVGSPNGWTSALRATDLVLSPAACYPIYPLLAQEGVLPAQGRLFDVAANCFRREPSRDLDRLQSFRMREFVCVGTPEQVTVFRQRWIDRAGVIAEHLALPYRIEQASDPFFGRTGQMMATAQLQMALKFELLVSLHSDAKPTACMSFNNHKDHFGSVWEIMVPDGQPAHSGCVAFGLDRLALALFWKHGMALGQWPECTRRALRL